MLGGLFEQRAISFQTLWGSGEDIVAGTQAGTIVDQNSVFKVNAIFSAVSLISDTVATLPIDAFIRRDGARFPFRPKPTWVTKPDVDTTYEHTCEDCGYDNQGGVPLGAGFFWIDD